MKMFDRFLVPVLVVTLLAIAPAISFAGPAESPPPSENPASDGEKPEMTPDEAREARVQEYLRKREEKRIAKEKAKIEKEAAKQAKQAQKEQARAQEEALEAERKMAEESAKAQSDIDRQMSSGSSRDSALPKRLARAQEDIRASRLGQDPTIQRYLDLVDSQQASPQQIAAFGNFIAEAGAREAALEYYAYALKLDKEDSLLWTNLGTLHRQMGDLSSAASAYAHAVTLERTSAIAHYNLGATFDAQGKYEKAVKEYKIALTLDPELADPAVNPQVANNERLLAVKMLIYKEQIGSMGTPLVTVPGGELPDGE